METQLPSFQQAPVPGQHVAGGATCVSISMAHVKYFRSDHCGPFTQRSGLCALYRLVTNPLKTPNKSDALYTCSHVYHRINGEHKTQLRLRPSQLLSCTSEWKLPHLLISSSAANIFKLLSYCTNRVSRETPPEHHSPLTSAKFYFLFHTQTAHHLWTTLPFIVFLKII